MKQLILISDGWPALDMAGISQTLYNLLDNFPASLSVLMPEKEAVPSEPRLKMTRLVYPAGPYRSLDNRLGKWLNPGLAKRQLQWRERHFRLPAQLPGPAEALVLVSTTDISKLHLSWILLRRGYTVIPYFMDDWMAGKVIKWGTNSLDQVIRDLLMAAPGWLLISEQLNQVLRKRYQLAAKPYLVIHNPAPDLSGSAVHISGDEMILQQLVVSRPSPNDPVRRESSVAGDQSSVVSVPVPVRTIIYAGSIWPMHADALLALANAVKMLHDKKEPVALKIFTSADHYDKYKSHFEPACVTYGGWLPQRQVLEQCRDAWLLLTTASFLAEFEAFSSTSVQTKLTDYMAANKPLLFVGPAHSASGEFINLYDCGFTIASLKPVDIAEQLLAIKALPQLSERKSKNGLQAALEIFSKPKKQGELYRFINELDEDTPVGNQ